MPPGSHRIRSIHYLRMIAAVMVVTYHVFSYHLMSADDPAMTRWLREGVGLFFGISGYVMVISTSASPPDPASFFWRRVRRIAPLYWIATACVVIGTGEENGWKILSSMLFLPSMGIADGPVLPVGWTLNFEMAFYALFALFLPVPRRIAIPALASILILASCISQFPDPPPLAAYYGQPILLDFVVGMLIAHFDFRLPGWLTPLGFLLLALAPQWTDIRPLTVTAPVALILASARSLDHKLKDWPLPTLLGEASYAIYLSHLFILLPALLFFGQDHAGGAVIAILASIVAGVIAHKYIEIPLTELLRQMERRGFGLAQQADGQAT
ncbi:MULTISPECIES: acyltransferase family protein [unclassified Sphingobium]|uniref:acyltransferase family protein n=1 Tax=unclassified Sphingobium TaxID=2611147 RepID=UPI0007704A7A|nr:MULTISPECIES: acyltransferase [Sphingomonadaceae]AMK23707.1 exopolysaccharide production protein ExoZ [Sphingobium sp. TKS]NML89470.1 acyltransferase [Sphingobium sp. TB-6]